MNCEADAIVGAIGWFYKGKVEKGGKIDESSKQKAEDFVSLLRATFPEPFEKGANAVAKALKNKKENPSLSVNYKGKKSGISKKEAMEIASGMSLEAKKLVENGKVQFVDNTFIANLLQHTADNFGFNARTLDDIKEGFRLSIIGTSSRKARNEGLSAAVNGGKDTGWELGLDGNFKYRLKSRPQLKVANFKAGVYVLPDLVDYPELFKEYPYLEKLKVRLIEDNQTEVTGEYSVLDDVTVNTARLNTNSLDQSFLEALGHEVQRSIQFTEMWDSGSNINSFKTSSRTSVIAEDYQKIFKALDRLKADRPELYDSLVGLLKNADLQKVTASDVGKLLLAYSGRTSEEFVTRLGKRLQNIVTNENSTELMGWVAQEVYLEGYGEVEARAAGRPWSGLDNYNVTDANPSVTVNRSTRELPVVSAVQGAYVRSDNAGLGDPRTSYININAVDKDSIKGVFLHEVGVHAFIDMLKSKRYDKEVAQVLDLATRLLERGSASNNKKVRDFFTGVELRLAKSKSLGNSEEVLAYIIEEAVNVLKEDKLVDINSTMESVTAQISKYISPVVAKLIEEVVKLVDKYWKKISGDIGDVQIQLDLDNLLLFAQEGVRSVSEGKVVELVSLDRASSDNALARLYNSIINNTLCE
jgi:hypothetical protein